MAGSGERGHRDGLRCVPALDPRGQNERQPVCRNRRVEKSDAETCERNRGENGLVHEHEKGLSRVANWKLHYRHGMARVYRADRIRTCDLSHPRRTLYQAEPQPELRVA